MSRGGGRGRPRGKGGAGGKGAAGGRDGGPGGGRDGGDRSGGRGRGGRGGGPRDGEGPGRGDGPRDDRRAGGPGGRGPRDDRGAAGGRGRGPDRGRPGDGPRRGPGRDDGGPQGGREHAPRRDAGRPPREDERHAGGDLPDGGQRLYGRNPVHEALRAGRRRVRSVWATSAALEGEAWLQGDEARRAGVVPRTATGEELEALCGTTDHQGVVAEVGPYPYVELGELLAGEAPLIVALDEVQDPQNVGAIARTAECVGATGVLLCRHRAAAVTPTVAKASAGAVEHLRIAVVRNLADALAEAKDAGCWSYGAAGDDAAVDYGAPDYRGGVVLVMGAEGTGLRPRVAAACDALVRLPLRGRIASLNVSAAASALLYEILQQRDVLDTET